MVQPNRNSLDPSALLNEGRTPIFLIRHGQTAWNLERRFLGKSDIPLDETGQTQACDLAERLNPLPLKHFYSSPLSRASQTAQAVIQRFPNRNVKMVQDLAELDQGELEGQKGHVLPDLYPDFFAAWQNDPAHARVPGGETLQECQNRAWEALHQIISHAAGEGTIAIFTHKMVICSILCRLLDLPLRQFRIIGQDNTAINILSSGPDGLRLHRLNDIEHLRR